MSTLPAVRIRLLNEENKQMVTSVNVPSPVDSDSRDPPPVRDKEEKRPQQKDATVPLADHMIVLDYT